MLRTTLRAAGALAAAAVVTIGATASARALGIGDPAPKITVKEFVKGTPIPEIKADKTYVVEFWATWCGPCKTSIPHLTELQKKYPQIPFVGVSVFEQDQRKVKPFVQQMGDKMAYTVAMDQVPDGGDPSDGQMAKNWMEAAEQGGIPTAFIVQKGKIAWIGHPMEMEEPLAKIVAGKWDVEKAAAEAKAAQEVQKRQQSQMQALNQKIKDAQQANDPAKMLAVLDEAFAETPELEGSPVVQLKIMALRDLGKDADAAAFVRKISTGSLKDNPAALNGIAWGVVDPDQPKKPGKELAKAAVEAAMRADELTQKNQFAIADTLAAAYFAAGDKANAISTQQRAVTLAKGSEQEKEMQERLNQYKAAP